MVEIVRKYALNMTDKVRMCVVTAWQNRGEIWLVLLYDIWSA